MKSIITVDVAVIFFVVIILLAHLLAPVEYDWKLNTISDLGAQQYKNAWLMRTGFIGFGFLLSTALLWLFIHTEEKNYSDLLIIVYALSVLLSGFFSTAPFIETATFSIDEDKWHSMFAQIAGVAFSFGILWHLLVYANENQKSIHLVFFILVIGFSALVGLSKNGLIPIGFGLIQRGLYVISFMWLLFRYR